MKRTWSRKESSGSRRVYCWPKKILAEKLVEKAEKEYLVRQLPGQVERSLAKQGMVPDLGKTSYWSFEPQI